MREPVRSSRSHSYGSLTPRGFVLVAGLALMLLGTPAIVAVALVTGAVWAYVAAAATCVTGLLTVGAVFAPARASFHAGTSIWQNDLPEGGGG